ncbi:MAG: twin-arginine translocase subunit TatC [Verrucomicrobiales bacterium]
MFLLNKLFQLRDQANPEEEKPFLEHLEDLRIMISRVMITLLVSTLICFTFKDDLMNVLRKPVEEVWIQKQENALPKDLDLDTWERALTLADATSNLRLFSSDVAESFWQEINDKDLRALTQAAIIYRAAKELPEDQQQSFLEKTGWKDPTLRERVATLLEKQPSTELNGQGNLRLMSSFKPTETFMLTMKLAFFAGIVIAFPFLLYFILQFIVPGLNDKERRMLWPALAIGFGLFIMGVLFAYFFVLPQVLNFFYDWGQGLGISNDWRIGYYISFATQFVLIFGLAFELPVVVMALVYLGILSYTMMSETRSYAVIAIMVVAAIITPTPDIATLSLLAAPMYVLYEICIWLAFFYEKREKRREAEEEKERLARLMSFQDVPQEEEPEGDSLSAEDEADLEDETESGEEEDRGDPLAPDEELVDVNFEEDPDYDPLAPPEDQTPEGERDRESGEEESDSDEDKPGDQK